MPANDRQVGGLHYKMSKDGEEHWDRQYRLFGRGYFIGCATKYIERAHLKNGRVDLEKAIHFIEKLMELEYPDMGLPPPPAWANPEHAPLASFPGVKPTGWVGFVFEGTTMNESLFTCRRCRQEVRCPVEMDPGNCHNCPKAG